MRCRHLGNLPQMVSEIGLGTAQLSNTDGKFHGVKYINPREARAILSVAIDHGINFFDTADNYGNAELLLGELSPDTKRKIFIATKTGLRKDGIRDFSEGYLRRQVDHSLQRLRVECLDLLQLNKPALRDLSDGRLFATTNSLKQEGKIKYAGVVVGDVDTGEICIMSGSVDCFQILYNLLYIETSALIEKAGQCGIGIIIRSPLNSGILSGAYTCKTTFPDNDERSQYFSRKEFHERLVVLGKIQGDLSISNENLLEFSLQYILSHRYVSVVIPGASTVAQAQRYIACGGRNLWNEGELRRIQEVVSRRVTQLAQKFQNI